jgi:asparagine synthase (glutamine-hydrolysing)
MCGIVAMFSTNQQISSDLMEKATQALNHRGPDGNGNWFSKNRNVGLGHTRLSIIDIPTGDQPISNQDERLAITVNGEFYGFEQIRRRLQKAGYRFKTNSDSEIALHLYDEMGTRCLTELRGEFAFVLWDEENKLLFAARDRFGIKPLYYTHFDGMLYMASEVKAFLEAGVPIRWDYESFFQIDSGVQSQSRTLFKNIYQLPPGHFLIATYGGVKITKYWDFDYVKQLDIQEDLSEEEVIENVRSILADAVCVRLRSDAPMACYLSGGIDSSTVASIASQYGSQKLDAFTVVFEDDIYNEDSYAQQIADLNDAVLHRVLVTSADLANHFADAIWHSETLCLWNPHSVAKYMLSKATRTSGYKTVLTGEGADEIFGGYASERRDMLLYNSDIDERMRQTELLEELYHTNEISKGIILPDGESEVIGSADQIIGFVPTWMETASANAKRTRRTYSSKCFDQFFRRDPYKVFLNELDISGQIDGREPLAKSLYTWSKAGFLNYLLRAHADGPEMANSVESRVPFLDHFLVEEVCKLPSKMKIKGLTEKYILREVAKPFICDAVYKRLKQPIVAPPSNLSLDSPLMELVQDTLRSKTMLSVPFYDSQKIISLLDSLPNMSNLDRASTTPTLMRSLSCCIIHEKFGITEES